MKNLLELHVILRFIFNSNISVNPNYVVSMDMYKCYAEIHENFK